MLTLALAACSDPAAETGNDFAVLAQANDAYTQARPGEALAFPRDHGAHPDYRIEWWYLTANLEDDMGRPWGLQWTLFRTAMVPPGDTVVANGGVAATDGAVNPWQNGQVYMAHFAVSAPREHRAFQRYARGGDHGGLRQAGVDASPFAAWLDDWRLESLGETWVPLRVRAAQGSVAVDLRLDSDRELVRQGEAGFSQKHPGGGGSWYYSHPWLQADGTVTFDGETVAVRGQAWLDREWSSQFLQPDQQGWDWFALHLDNGDKLMAFQLRSAQEGGAASYGHAVLLTPDGRRKTAAPGEVSFKPLRRAMVAGREVPMAWALSWPGAGVDLEVEAGLDEQWMDVDFPYWEGRVEVREPAGRRVGVGYLEMTGYGPPGS
ncbi:MAG: lipocalin-like domain-containing protein [Xanthomonadales bacterium]|nr:lipocalin-like domain-containing protein [Xanthomonadales bacterium]